MDLQGEHLDVDERIVVTPTAGVFVATDQLPETVDVGSTIGHVHTTTEVTPVRSSFRGRLVSLVATTGERVGEHQRVAWLRLT